MEGARVDTSKVKWQTVRDAMARVGAIPAPSDPWARFIWFDSLPAPPSYGGVRRSQRSNRIPGMDVICYKTSFFTGMKRMQTFFPELYNFFPTTYILPGQYSEFTRDHVRNSVGKKQTWILKPRAGSCGTGIKLVQEAFEVSALGPAAVIQKYVSPFLLEELKFDLRLYVVVGSLLPFSLFLYNEGLARFCTVPYEAPARHNLAQRYMHLSNTAVNVTNESQPHPILELATSVLRRVTEADPRGHRLWDRICDVVFLAVVAQYPDMIQGAREQPITPAPQPMPDLGALHQYFHLCGIDVIISDRCEPVVLELNDRPCLTVTYQLEKRLKEDMLVSLMSGITLDGSPPSALANFTRLWPLDGPAVRHRDAVFGRAAWMARVSRPVPVCRRSPYPTGQ